MNEARIYVDLNERVDKDMFLLSKYDTTVDSKGNSVTFYENMPIKIWSDDGDEEVPHTAVDVDGSPACNRQ